VEFEFDATKSHSNLLKHGIDFDSAKDLWLDECLLEVPARTTDEERWIAIGRISGVSWSAIYTPRNARIRIISVRRSRPEEVLLYESQDL